jgi:ribose/xylose/arabinose/galactoside ABC-type transport system permease subunit
VWNPAFVRGENLLDLVVQAAPVVMIGAALTLVVLTGEIDISVGSLYGLLAAWFGVLSSPSQLGVGTGWAVLGVVGAGAAAGALNGVLVTVGRVPSIIATLGMLTVLRGVTEVVLHGEWITDLPAGVRALGTGTVMGMPACVWAAAVVVGVMVVLTRLTRFGVRVYAVGGNAEAARAARISAARTKMAAFTITGAVVGVAVVVCVPQQSVIESGIGSGMELVAVTAVLIGGTSIRGGRGGVLGTVVAALLLGSIRTVLVFLQLGAMATYWERAIQGVFILAAVVAEWASRRREGEA